MIVMDGTTASSDQINRLLTAWTEGDRAALDALIPLVYEELRRMAKRYMSRQRPGHTLQTTALINEAYMRLVGQAGLTCNNRSHFFGVAAKAMRHVLVDHARRAGSEKRGGNDAERIPLDDSIVLSRERPEQMVALNDALQSLEKLHERQAKVVELKYFGGMSVEEVADHLQISMDPVARDWRAAKVWL
jgi:RNA polymerase sigma factor (TIGR02999 family)